MIHTIDLHFQERPGTIASFVMETENGLALVESGPASTLPSLEIGLQTLGHALADVRHVFLTHIHFDHAGAAWRLAELGAQVYVHPFGMPHLQDPKVLWKSAKRIYHDRMESLWGEMQPIAETQLHAIEDQTAITVGQHRFIAHHTPGHAKHHIAWQLDRILFAGDVAGVRLQGGPVQPPCPPPDIDIEGWHTSIQRMRALVIDQLYLTHFDIVTDIGKHLDELDATLDRWATWMHPHAEQGTNTEAITSKFVDFVREELTKSSLSTKQIADYETANPAFMSVGGLMRYWKKRLA